MKKLPSLMVLLVTLFLTSCTKDISFETPNDLTIKTLNVDSGIIAKYLFTNNSVDSTPFRNDGRLVNASFVSDRFGRCKSSYYSNDGFMESNNIPFNIAKNYTITFWVKMLGFTEGNALLELNKDKRYDQNPIVWMSKNYIYLSQCNKSQNRIKIGYIPDMTNKWVNVTWTLCNGITTLYVNGQRVGVANFVYPSYFGITLTLGNAGNVGSRYRSQPSDACIDDVIIYNRCLSECEISHMSKN